MEMERERGLEGVADLALRIIMSKLGAKDTARVACVSKRLRESALEDSLWSQFCWEELNLSSPLDPFSHPCPSFLEAYKSWREAFGMYPWPLVLRVKRCWDRLNTWLSNYFPEVCPTLRKAATESHIHHVEKLLKVKLPLPTRLLYRFCDGQELGTTAGSPISPLGLIGGYSFNQHRVNVYLLPLTQVLKKTRKITRQHGIQSFSDRTKYIVVAASSTYSEKLFFLNCTNGQLYVGTRNLPMDGKMMPCVPNSLINLLHDNSGHQQDATLLWLEEHCRRLENGIIKVREEGRFRTICQFPEEPPFCSSAVTNGVKVRASAVFVPELSDLEDDTDKNWFSYSIRMALLPEGCMINGMYFSSCQLHQRHWIIRVNDAVISDVNGEAVIGQYPLLLPGESEFVYESFIPLPTSSGSLEGSFNFVPGRLIDPKGSPFEATVARFPLQVPDYIF